MIAGCQNNVTRQLFQTNNKYAVGHDYLFYVYIKTGYQVIPVSPAANTSNVGYISFLQSATGGRIAHFQTDLISGTCSSSTLGHGDFYWNNATGQWLQNTVQQSSPNKCAYYSHYLRVITSDFQMQINETLTWNNTYLKPGSYNVTAMAQPSGEVLTWPFTVDLGMQHAFNFWLKISLKKLTFVENSKTRTLM